MITKDDIRNMLMGKLYYRNGDNYIPAMDIIADHPLVTELLENQTVLMDDDEICKLSKRFEDLKEVVDNVKTFSNDEDRLIWLKQSLQEVIDLNLQIEYTRELILSKIRLSKNNLMIRAEEERYDWLIKEIKSVFDIFENKI